MAELSRGQAKVLAPLFVATSLLLLTLLSYNLRNVDTGVEEPPPIVVDEPEPGEVASGDAIGTLRAFFVTSVLMLGVIVVVGTILLYRQGINLRKLFSVWELFGYALATLFLILVFLNYDSIVAGLRSSFEQIVTVVAPSDEESGSAAGPGEPISPAATSSYIVLWFAIALSILQLLLFAYRFLPRMQRLIAQEEPTTRGRQELMQAVQTAIRDLEAGADFRAVVLRCYRTMVLLFAQHGLLARPSQTAREFEADALRGLGISQESIDDLTSLFEEARYSAHPIGAVQRDGAIECLGAIRGQLEATP